MKKLLILLFLVIINYIFANTCKFDKTQKEKGIKILKEVGIYTKSDFEGEIQAIKPVIESMLDKAVNFRGVESQNGYFFDAQTHYDVSKLKNLDSIIFLAKNKKSAFALAFIYQMSAFDVGETCKECKVLISENLDVDFSEFAKFMANEISLENIKNTNFNLKKLYILESSAIMGEALLCDGLETNDTQKLLVAYAYFSLAGRSERALDTLLEGVKRNDKNAGITLNYLLNNGIFTPKNLVAAKMLEREIAKDSVAAALNNQMITKNLKTFSLSSNANIVDYMLYWRLVETGKILDLQDSKYENLGENNKKDIQENIAKMLSYTNKKRALSIESRGKNDKILYNKITDFIKSEKL
ncbi:hypothetical protein DCO58_03575 [Helicobacter saguini]|uniref:Uncharacterized protein n=1 Tax=Helicobacter saguini TaxID=1548018 RepID=A0A347VSD3_9HELI|nr:hypothetical protein [Helicobacter saguini]MWV62553.1 hypothetical protein [Helicobacter saguini]MWV66773.1 hypothetical protein [Helicobacter saguini]MWV69124.1 hypothetical protein [Helicobacter saguini]MWV71321.1 hypothetical protein [Helicobacter saguini]TLD94169.1 hypothetical protein LS64_006595 [Helicobacter saguini]